MGIIKKLSKSLPIADHLAFSNAYPQIRKRFLCITAIWFAVTAALAVGVWLLMQNFKAIPALSAVSVMLMGAILVFWLLLAAFESACKKELPQGQQPPTMMQMQADQNADAEQTKLRNERLTMLAGCVFIFPLCPVFLLIAAIRAACAKHTPGTAACAAVQYASGLTRKAHAVTIFFIPILFLCMFVPVSWQKRGQATVTSMNQTAHSILNAAQSYQIDLDTADQLPKWSTVIAEVKAPASEFTVQYGVQQYCPELKKTNLWYAVVIDRNGTITEAYCSRKQLTAEKLTPPDTAEQNQLASNPVHASEVIGYWKNQ